MNQEELTPDQRETARLLAEHFLLGGEELLEPVEAIAEALPPSPLAEPGAAFLANLSRTLTTLRMPQAIAFGTLTLARAGRVIREGVVAGLTDDQLRAQVLALESEASATFLEAYSHLRSQLSVPTAGLLESAKELLHQGAVTLWGAFEVLARDTLRILLRLRPALGESLKPEDVEGLRSLWRIRDAFASLFPEAVALRERLTDSLLELLYRRRNVLVHRRGIVDEQYRRESRDTAFAVGESLRLTPQDVRRCAATVGAAGGAVLQAAVTYLETP